MYATRCAATIILFYYVCLRNWRLADERVFLTRLQRVIGYDTVSKRFWNNTRNIIWILSFRTTAFGCDRHRPTFARVRTTHTTPRPGVFVGGRKTDWDRKYSTIPSGLKTTWPADSRVSFEGLTINDRATTFASNREFEGRPARRKEKPPINTMDFHWQTDVRSKRALFLSPLRPRLRLRRFGFYSVESDAVRYVGNVYDALIVLHDISFT